MDPRSFRDRVDLGRYLGDLLQNVELATGQLLLVLY